MEALLYMALGALLAIVGFETVVIVTLWRFLRAHDIYPLSDDWFPVRRSKITGELIKST